MTFSDTAHFFWEIASFLSAAHFLVDR
jgi:hypothetical protein